MKTNRHPPRLAWLLFRWYCSNAQVEDLLGDLEEIFYRNLEKMPPGKAKLIYWQSICLLLFSYAVKRRKKHASYHPLAYPSFTYAMFKNYFTVATRSLGRQRFFTIVNIVGLAIGMSVSLLLICMLTYISHYDSFHKKKDRIYRITSRVEDGVDNNEYASAPSLLAEKMQQECSGLTTIVRIQRELIGPARYKETEVPLAGYFVDPEFLDVFTFPLIKGNPATALQKLNSVLITEKAARKIFGNQDPVGQVIAIGKFGDFEITGLLKDHPKNSHMQFEIISSYQTLEAWQESQAIDVSVTWQNFRNQYIYLLLDEKTRSNEIASYLKSATRTIDRDPSGHQVSFAIQALNDIVPGPELYNQIGPEWGYLSLYIFGILSLLILLPACFNYTNLSISRALKRAKEIGLRKAMGGQQNQIFLQFITETVLITLLSLLGAFGIFALVREEFLSLLVSADALELNVDMQTTACFILFAVCVGLVAGVLPAIYFSRLNPVQALRNVIPGGMLAGMSLRKCLMVFQFALSLGFIMSVAIILKQYRSALNYDFGFERANILDVELQDVDPQLFRNEFSKLAAIQTISMSSGIMGTSTPDRVWLKKTDHGDSLQAFEMLTDQHYVKNLSLTLLAGTGFSDNVNENKEQILINEEFLKEFKLGAPAEAVGQSLIVPGQGNVHIRGVVKDFHYMLLDERIHSFFFRYDSDHARYANLKIASNDLFKTFTDMEAAWERVSDQRVFHAKFFEDEIEETFMGYFSIVKICSFLGILAISISCLGLLGMVVYAAENRTKEVGIRKIMGATNLQLVVLLSKSFLRLLFFSTVVAVPVTYFLFDTMLRHMQYYQINIGVLEIVISIFVMLLLGVITTLSQTLRVVKTNPADTMRCE